MTFSFEELHFLYSIQKSQVFVKSFPTVEMLAQLRYRFTLKTNNP